jgi:hypothetical protein
LDESLLSVSDIGRFVAADNLVTNNWDKAGLNLGLVVAFTLQSQVFHWLHARARGGPGDGLSESNPDTVHTDESLTISQLLSEQFFFFFSHLRIYEFRNFFMIIF